MHACTGFLSNVQEGAIAKYTMGGGRQVSVYVDS